MGRTGSPRSTSLSLTPRRSPRIEKRKQEYEDCESKVFKSKLVKLPELKSRCSRKIEKTTKPVKVKKSRRPPPQKKLEEVSDGSLLREIENDWTLTPPSKTSLPQTKSSPVQWSPRKLSPIRKNFEKKIPPDTDPTYSPRRKLLRSRKNSPSRKASCTRTDPPPRELSPPRTDPPRLKALPSRKLSKPKKNGLSRKLSPPQDSPPREDTPSRELSPSLLSTPPAQKSPLPTLSPPERLPTPWGVKLRKIKTCGSVASVAETILLDDDDNVSSGIERKKAVDDSDRLILEYQSTACGNKGALALYTSDINCLDAGEFINDKIVDFWLNYILHENGINAADLKKTVVFSSLFYNSWRLQEKKMKDSKSVRYPTPDKNKPNLGVRRGWTKGIRDLFLKDFIFVPIPQDGHWILAVICYHGMIIDNLTEKLGPSKKNERVEEELQQQVSKTDMDDFTNLQKVVARRREKHLKIKPMIIIFDSFKSLDLQHKVMAASLRNLLEIEWKERYGFSLSFTKDNVRLEIPEVPQQNNWYDCGNYVLQFFECFFRKSLPREPPIPSLLSWFDAEKVEGKRKTIYEKIFSIVKESHPDRIEFMPKLKV